MRNRSVWVLAALTGAAGMMLFAETAQAQRRGGGGYGGGGGSGFGVSVGRGGISFGTGGYGGYGYGSGYGYGGYGRGGYYGPGYGYGSGFGIGVGSGLRSSYYGGPYYGGGSYYSTPSYGGSYYDGGSYYSGGAPSAYSDGSYESSEPMGSLNVTVHVPRADARVVFNGVTSTSNSNIRHFETSAMAPGRPYNFQVEAFWMEGGREVRQTRNITGYAGQTLDVNFMGAAGTTGTSTDRTPGLTPVDPARTPVTPKGGTDRTPGVSKDLLPGTGTDRTPVVPDRTPGVGGGSDRVLPDVPDRR